MENALLRLIEAGALALPLHDALLCLEEDVKVATKALEEAFARLLGSRPQMRIKAVQPVEAPRGP